MSSYSHLGHEYERSAEERGLSARQQTRDVDVVWSEQGAVDHVDDGARAGAEGDDQRGGIGAPGMHQSIGLHVD